MATQLSLSTRARTSSAYVRHMPSQRDSRLLRLAQVRCVQTSATVHERLQARSAALVKLAEEEYAAYPQVNLSLKSKVALGEVWKVCGAAPELGRWVPEIAPTMTWHEGDVWKVSFKMSPGVHKFKCVLRKGIGKYEYEEGPDRVLEIAPGSANEVIDMTMDTRVQQVQQVAERVMAFA